MYERGPAVLCDESGHTKFPFLYLAHVTMIALAQARLRIGSGLARDWLKLAQDWLKLAQPKNHFRKATPQHP